MNENETMYMVDFDNGKSVNLTFDEVSNIPDVLKSHVIRIEELRPMIKNKPMVPPMQYKKLEAAPLYLTNDPTALNNEEVVKEPIHNVGKANGVICVTPNSSVTLNIHADTLNLYVTDPKNINLLDD